MSPTPVDNARKVRAMLTGNREMSVLYRTCAAGPSGQRAYLCVGRAYVCDGTDEYETSGYDISIYEPRGGPLAGYARRELHATHGLVWSITREYYDGALQWIGYADTLSLGMDVCVHGLHAATGRHDSRRVSGGRFHAAATLTD